MAITLGVIIPLNMCWTPRQHLRSEMVDPDLAEKLKKEIKNRKKEEL
jgi:hypothetical protein